MKQNLNNNCRAALLALCLAAPSRLLAVDLPILRLVIKDHRFSPATLSAPSGVKFKLVVANQDGEPAEFESFILHREQVVLAGKEAVIFLGPLKDGRYEFFDDFHTKTRGWIEAAAQAAAK